MTSFASGIATSPDWMNAVGAVQILVALQLLDVAMGVLVSIKKSELCSTIGWNGFTRKIGTIMVICMVAVFDPLVPGPLAQGAAVAYCGWEAVSFLEKAGMLGIWIPPGLMDILKKVRGSSRSQSSKTELKEPD